MKTAKSKRRRYLKLFLELVVIFLSVVLAFFFDDFRESNSEEAQYTKDLKTFRTELIDEISNMKVKLDTFKVPNDLGYRGDDLKELLNLVWLDSLIDNKAATASEFKFVIQEYFSLPYVSTNTSLLLSQDLQTRYSEHVKNEMTLTWLKIYGEEMQTLQQINQSIKEANARLGNLISKTDPYLNFDKDDLSVFYSKEFIWNYKQVVRMMNERFQFMKWLTQERLVKVVAHLDEELLALGETSADHPCFVNDFRRRYECENNKPVNKDEVLSRVDQITIAERNEFLRSNRLR